MPTNRCISCVAGYPIFLCLRGGTCVTNNDQEAKERIEESDEGFEEVSVKSFVDPVSTGRKRAAVLYKIAPGQVCDWAFRKNCGGGVLPIVGCTGKPAAHIHHGPDKSTLNNDRDSNISLVCHFCHNRWHVANDKYYATARPLDNSAWLPTPPEGQKLFQLSDSIPATKEEVLVNELTHPQGGKDRSKD